MEGGSSNAPYPTLVSAMRQLKPLCRAAGSPEHGAPHPSPPHILYIYQKAARGVRATSNAPYPTLGSAMRQLKTLCRAAGSPGHGGPRPSPPDILFIYHKAARGLCGAKGPARRRGDVGPPKYPKDGRRLPYASPASPETDRERRSRRPRDRTGRAGVAPWPASSVRRAPAPHGTSHRW